MACLSPAEVQALLDELAGDPDDKHVPPSVRYDEQVSPKSGMIYMFIQVSGMINMFLKVLGMINMFLPDVRYDEHMPSSVLPSVWYDVPPS